MGLFSFGDINIRESVSNVLGLENSALSSDTYTSLRFPIDIGNADKGHYMVIYVNEQNRTQFPTPLSGNVPTILSNRRNSGMGNISTIFSPSNNLRRTIASIALYMPDTLEFTNSQNYDDFGIGGSPAAAVLSGLGSVEEAIKARKAAKDVVAGAAKNLAAAFFSTFAINAMNGNLFGGGNGSGLFQAATGLSLNPMMEVIYTKPEFRRFTFSFLMHPRSQAEAKNVQDIINLLKFHQAPEILKESKGFFLVPPSAFDIKFFYNGVENPNIEKVSTCVLENMSVNYAPQGFSSYEIPGVSASKGGTGMPVAIRLDLSFKEIEYMTKDHYKTLNPYDDNNNFVGVW